jgi:hypothetical protein
MLTDTLQSAKLVLAKRTIGPQSDKLPLDIWIRTLNIAAGCNNPAEKDEQEVRQDHRHYNRDGQAFNVGETFAGLPFERGIMLADKLKPWVPEGMTMAQMALRWILDFDAVSVVIPGATAIQHVRDNAAASDLPPLSQELHRTLRDFYQNEVEQHIRGPY